MGKKQKLEVNEYIFQNRDTKNELDIYIYCERDREKIRQTEKERIFG